MNLYRAAIKELRTVRDLLRFAVSRFQQAQLHYGHGTSNAYDEAAYLILHTLHLPIDSLNPYLDARLTESEREAIVQVLERRVKERIPAPYLTQEAWLQGYAFYVDQRVIVPRSFIAELLLDQLAPWVQDPHQVGQILELCTGSGCLSIIAAEVFPNAKIIAADISPAALEVARKNVDTYGLQQRIRLLESDLFTQVPKKKFDLILVNPPYVPAASMDALPAEFRAEPELALSGGQDGLDLVHQLLSQAGQYLKKNGLMLVEVGHERPAVEAAYPDLPLTWLSTSAGDDMVFMYSQ
jgi:ribosomal protein L3 glutamine methyltransferase